MVFSFLKYFIITCFLCRPILSANSTIKLISVIFRHGDRTPVIPFELYPKDPYKKFKYNPPGYGQLTQSGELRAYDLGKFLRNKYNEYLESNYTTGYVEARSTDINRTKESLKFALKGLYSEASVLPIINSIYKDHLFFPQLCMRYNLEYIKASRSSDVKQELLKLKDFRKKLSKWTGKLIKTSRDMYFIYTTLESQKFMNLSLPSWTNGIYPDGDLLKGAVLELKLLNYNNKMKRLNGGMLLRKVIDDMKSVRNGTMDKNRKILLYSAHDINVAAVLFALDVFYPHMPKYTSAVIIELNFEEEKFFVKVLYFQGIPNELKELKLPGCEVMCPLDQFFNLTKNILSTDTESCKQDRTVLIDELREIVKF